MGGDTEKAVTLYERLKADRITVVSQTYYQRLGKNPIQVESRFSRGVSSGQQLYQREEEVGENWVPLDLGWITKVGFLEIANNEGRFLQVIPTEEEREDTAKKILEVRGYDATCSSGCLWLVPPGESFRGFPSKPQNLFIRSQLGTIEYTLYVFPG